MDGKRILMLIGEYSEEYEIFVVQQAMEALGHSIDIVCPDTKKGDRVTTSVHDFGPGVMTWTEHKGRKSRWPGCWNRFQHSGQIRKRTLGDRPDAPATTPQEVA